MVFYQQQSTTYIYVPCQNNTKSLALLLATYYHLTRTLSKKSVQQEVTGSVMCDQKSMVMVRGFSFSNGQEKF